VSTIRVYPYRDDTLYVYIDIRNVHVRIRNVHVRIRSISLAKYGNESRVAIDIQEYIQYECMP